MKKDKEKMLSQKEMSVRHVEFLPDPDAIEQRPLAGVTRGVLVVLSSMLLIFLVWAWISDIDEIVGTRGRLITSQPHLIVQPLETAIVQAIDVRVGQVVKKGQRLAALDPTFVGADESQLRSGFSSLDARTRRLEGELAAKQAAPSAPTRSADERLQSELRAAKAANYQARLQAMGENLSRLEASLQTNKQDQQMLEGRVKSLTELEQMQERLVNQNFGAKQSLIEARARRQEVDRDLLLTRNRQLEIEREIAAARADRQAYEKEWRQRTMEELADVRRERDSTADQLQKAERRSSLVTLDAPVDAVVLEIAPRSIGSVVQAAEKLFTLVPLDVPLEVEVEITARDVGFVRTGNTVRIKLDAYPFQKHGSMEGRVTVVSQDAFTRETPSGAITYYLARIELVNTALERVPTDFRLLPGLAVSGEIKVGRRSILSYFLYPMIRTLDESIREPR